MSGMYDKNSSAVINGEKVTLEEARIRALIAKTKLTERMEQERANAANWNWVDVEEVLHAFREIFRNARSRLAVMPRKIAPKLTAFGLPVAAIPKVEAEIEAEVRQALLDLSRFKLPEQPAHGKNPVGAISRTRARGVAAARQAVSERVGREGKVSISRIKL